MTYSGNILANSVAYLTFATSPRFANNVQMSLTHSCVTVDEKIIK